MTNWGRLGVFDLETTGVDVDTSRIVSACIAVIDDDGEVVDRWDWLADPGIEIPEGASAVHGITTERARALGRPAVQVVAEIAQTLRVLFSLGMPVVVYNAPYDLTLLDRECRRHQLRPLEVTSPVIDPLVLDKAMDRYRKGKRTLEVTAERYGVPLDDAHDAGSDAIAAGRVAQALLRAYPEELGVPTADLHGRQEVWYAEQAASFQEYIRSVKGDGAYVADTAWPLRPSEHPRSLIDTQPIPAPEPRPSLTVPVVDLYGTGTLSLEALSTAPAEAFAVPSALATSAPPSAYASAPPPAQPRKPTVLRVAAGIITDETGRTLLVRKVGSSAFMQAGGKIEPGESALDALSRELREEIGLELDPDLTEYLGSFRAVAANEPDTVIRAEVFALVATGDFAASGEIEELVWIEDPVSHGLELAELTRDTILPLWVERRSALF
ncbi:MAG: NUDIX domain-containing protein [Microbacteriaceae bacterium]|nr:NUDIX domain-containing protein [Microbacteriaceae bacterium]